MLLSSNQYILILCTGHLNTCKSNRGWRGISHNDVTEPLAGHLFKLFKLSYNNNNNNINNNGNMPQLNHQVVTRPLKSVVSASWLYPFKGIYFFVTNPAFWPLLGRRLIPLAFVSIIVFGFLFTFAYFPQVAFLALLGHGPGAFLNATFLVLGEGAVIIALLFEAFLVDETLVDVFDAVIRPFPLSSKVID
jgi:hypothetical protein